MKIAKERHMTLDLEIPDFLNLRLSQAERDAAAAQLPRHAPARIDQPRELTADEKTAQRLAAFRALKREKSRGRVAKMKARMSDKAALAAGLKWDVVRGGWR